MNSTLRLHYQRQLIYAGLDDFNPNSVFPNYLGGESGGNRLAWRREVVNFLDIGVGCGLLAILNWNNLFSSLVLKDVKFALSGNRVSEAGLVDEDIIWNSLYFFGTESLVHDLDRFGLLKWGSLLDTENLKFLDFIQEKYKIELGV